MLWHAPLCNISNTYTWLSDGKMSSWYWICCIPQQIENLKSIAKSSKLHWLMTCYTTCALHFDTFRLIIPSQQPIVRPGTKQAPLRLQKCLIPSKWPFHFIGKLCICYGLGNTSLDSGHDWSLQLKDHSWKQSISL